jgi:hypothetical protein
MNARLKAFGEKHARFPRTVFMKKRCPTLLLRSFRLRRKTMPAPSSHGFFPERSSPGY